MQQAPIPRLFPEVVAGIGRDMDGRVLSTAFEQSPQIETIDSWENIDGDDGRHPPGMQDEQAPAARKNQPDNICLPARIM